MTLDYEVYKEGGLLRDRYKLIEDISEGSYGYVSLASDTQLKKLVAVKYIFKSEDDKGNDTKDGVMVNGDEKDDEASNTVNSSQEKKQRLLKHQKSLISDKVLSRFSNNVCFEALYEVDIQTKIGKHKNITELYDFFDSYIIMEYCSGGDLYEAIKDDMVPRKTKNVTNIINQILDAVEYVHSRGIYHRDIKPENILIAGNWNIKLTDWGLATTDKTSMERNVGSERYMAPELFESNLDREERTDAYDCAKVDIWAIGIVMLNIVFHKNPFTVANQTDKAFCYFAANREALFDVFSTMSYDFFQVLRHALTIDPTNRNLEKVRTEIKRLSEYTMDDEYYNSLDSDEESVFYHYPPPALPPKSAPTSVSAPSMAPMSPLHSTAPATVATTVSGIISTVPAVGETGQTPQKPPAITVEEITPEPSVKQNKEPVPRFTFTKRSHNRSKSNGYQNNKNTKKNTPAKHDAHGAGGYKNYKSNIKPIQINNNEKIIKNSRKPLAIPTPNTHINNFFHEYKSRDDVDDFNTRDYFTPPSVHNRYMEGVFSKKNKRFNQWSKSPKTNGTTNNGNRRGSFNQDNNGNRKYVPPHSRKSFDVGSPSIPHLSSKHEEQPPIHTMTYHEQHALSVDNEPELDDVLFTLEESDGFDGFINDMSDLSINTQQSSHSVNLTANGNNNQAPHGLPDLFKSPQVSHVNINDPLNNHVTLAHSARRPTTSSDKGISGVYVPPHHRKSFNIGHDNLAPGQHTNGLKRNSFGNRKPVNVNVNGNGGLNAQDRFILPHNPYLSAASTSLQKNDVFIDNDAVFFEDDEPHFFSAGRVNSPGKIRTGRKSSSKQDEVVGSLEQYKNNWLMLQQYQD
ncbi:Ksp1 [Kluyveromyces lactis]|nr:Ksp1 [Kluyveromyces lactis]